MNKLTASSLVNALSFLFFFFSINLLTAQNYGKLWSVVTEVEVSKDPVQITIRWNEVDKVSRYQIYRRVFGSTDWGMAINPSDISPLATSYVDTDVTLSTWYEYKIIATRTEYPIFSLGYVCAGIEIENITDKGTMALLIDNSFQLDLQAELEELTLDLIGDGWQVIQIPVDREDSPIAVKAQIQTSATAHPNLKALYLIGQIPVPYSGMFAVDSHLDHVGAWPADIYYGDLDGVWTDITVNNTTATDPRNHNEPGDGKFDQSSIPSLSELQIGRIDFSNLTDHPTSELNLLKAYLNKAHQFKHGEIAVNQKALIDDNFQNNAEGFAGTAWRSFGGLIGKNNVNQADYFTETVADNFLLSYASGGGTYSSINGVGTTDDFIDHEVRSIFNFYTASYLGDWDSENNFMRMTLTSGDALTSAWVGRPHWMLQGLGLGKTIGFVTLLSQNNSSLNGYYPSGNFAQGVHQSLMGDPTLRTHPVLPPENVSALLEDDEIILQWEPAIESYVGFNVYKSNSKTGEYNKLNDELITTQRFVDTDTEAAHHYYMVKGVKLQETPSGSYYNNSQGVFADVASVGALALPVDLLSFTTQKTDHEKVNLNWVTVTEENVSHFEVQRSADAALWEAIGEVKAFGNSVELRNYSLIDVLPFSGNNYYRLKMIDRDGTFEFSDIKLVQFQGNEDLQLSVFPNPAAKEIHVRLPNHLATNNGTLQIFDSKGALVLEQAYSINLLRVNIEHFQTGIYTVKINSDSFSSEYKLLKTN